jgi:hypothetical protein
MLRRFLNMNGFFMVVRRTDVTWIIIMKIPASSSCYKVLHAGLKSTYLQNKIVTLTMGYKRHTTRDQSFQS